MHRSTARVTIAVPGRKGERKCLHFRRHRQDSNSGEDRRRNAHDCGLLAADVARGACAQLYRGGYTPPPGFLGAEILVLSERPEQTQSFEFAVSSWAAERPVCVTIVPPSSRRTQCHISVLPDPKRSGTLLSCSQKLAVLRV